MKIGISGSGERPMIGEGIKILTLKGCEIKAVPDRFSDRQGATKDKILWKFCSVQGEEYGVWTNTSYGSDKATLTHLLDMMLPGITKEQAANLDTDEFVGKNFRARIVHKTNDATGKTYAQHTFIEPMDDATAPQNAPLTTPTAGLPTLADPFADDEEEKL